MQIIPKNNYKKLFSLARELRKSQTDSEKILWNILRNRKFIDLKFTRQRIFGEFIVDFYCAKLKLAIELDGKIHEFQQEKDENREKYLLNNFGVKVLRIKNEELKNKDFYEDLENKIKKLTPHI